MASNKKKQDEKHLKILRDMVALPHNKQCFDCHQRGPTYVNMTIGSYVCTSCSGILRGLNPPQRVKSISMASFTPEEIEFLKCRGNEFCRKVFLGLYDSRQNPEPDSRDEQKIRDFMVQKYENKRWYVAPPESLKEECRRINEAALNKQPQTKPLRSLLGENVPKLVTQNNQSPQMQRPAASNPPPVVAASVPSSQPPQAAAPHAPTAQPRAPPAAKPQSGFDLLGELGGDPFGSSAPPPNSAAGGGFADFSAFNSQPAPAASTPAAFPVSSTPLQPVGSALAASTANPGFGAMAAPKTQAPVGGGGGGDKYAALADLDQVFHTSTESTPAPVTNTGAINWGGTPTGGSDGSSGGLGWTVGTGGGGGGSIPWGGSGGGAPTGGPVSWNGTSAAASVPSTMSWSSPMAVSSAGSAMYGGQPAQTDFQIKSHLGVPGNPFLPHANPFGGPPTSAAMPGAANPFAVGQPAMFGQQPAAAGGFGQFGSQPQAFPQYSMQNGGFPGMHPTTAPAFSMTQTAPTSSAGFGAGWGVPPQQPTANPFMSAATQQQVPPRSSSTNPFL